MGLILLIALLDFGEATVRAKLLNFARVSASRLTGFEQTVFWRPLQTAHPSLLEGGAHARAHELAWPASLTTALTA